MAWGSLWAARRALNRRVLGRVELASQYDRMANSGPLESLPVEGNPQLHPRASPRLRVDVHGTAEHLGPLAHGSQADPPRGHRIRDRLRVKPLPVVLHQPT